MPPLQYSRYEFAPVETDDCGRQFLDVPPPIFRESRPDDQTFTIGAGETVWVVAWKAFRALLDPELDVGPSRFFWVVCEYNDIVDPVNDPPPPGTRLRVPSVETLLREVLSPPRFRTENRET